MLSDTRLQIGAFVLDASVDEISGPAGTAKLEPRATKVLAYLARRPGEVVSVDELLAQVWSGVIVTPDSVYRAVNAIRKVFNDDPRAPQYIANVPRRGYRLIAPVSSLASQLDTPPEGSVAASPLAPRAQVRPGRRFRLAACLLIAAIAVGGAWALRMRTRSAPPPAPAAEPAAASIAVLPFVDISEAHDQGYFVDGLTEEVLDLLTRVQGLQVIARTSSFAFRDSAVDIPTIARRLHVAHVLEGSVRKSGDHLRVTTQLIRADTGVHVWSETYERELRDVFSLQDEIAAGVVAALRVRLLPAQQPPATARTTSLVAYNEYLLGREFHNHGTPEGFRKAAEAYRRAIALDPDYAQAYAELALADIVVADEDGTTGVRIAPALAASNRAIALSPDRAEGYAARGYLRYSYVWDWRGAQADFATALSREPGDSVLWRRYADLLASTGRLREAITADRRATALDPLSAAGWGNLGMYLAAAGDYAEAGRALHKAIEISPDSPFALNGLATLKLLEGEPGEARSLYQRINEAGFRLTGTAMAEHSMGHAEPSRRALAEMLAESPGGWAYEIAEAYAWCGESARALEWLGRAHAAHDPGMTAILIDPLLRDLRRSAGYEALLRQMNLPLPDAGSKPPSPNGNPPGEAAIAQNRR